MKSGAMWPTGLAAASRATGRASAMAAAAVVVAAAESPRAASARSRQLTELRSRSWSCSRTWTQWRRGVSSASSTPSPAAPTLDIASATGVASTGPSAGAVEENLPDLGGGEYEKALRALYTVNQRIGVVKQGLDNISRLNEQLGDPAGQIRAIHVTGTNGKGSVCWKLARALYTLGFRTGLFVSPHVSSFRERMRMGDVLITEDEVVSLLGEVMRTAEAANIPATFFEHVTAAGLLYFARQQADVVVMEAGLGGRLDSTNVLRNPLLTVITNVGLEHTRVLGDTRERIAWEKAGIAKNGTPMLIGPRVPRDPVEDVCSQVGAPLHVVKPGPVRLGWDYDEENIACARRALELLGHGEALRRIEPILQERPPCRFEVIQIPARPASLFIVDAAHNAPALEVVLDTLHNRIGELAARIGVSGKARVRVVFALSGDKDAAECMQAFRNHAGLIDELVLTKSASSRAQDPHVLLEAHGRAEHVSLAATVSDALQVVSKEPEITVVCGSIFMMTETRQALGLEHPSDPVAHKAPAS